MTDPADPLDALLPLTPVVAHALVALAGRPLHGYAIAQEVEEVTDGRVRMGPGTLYGALQRMRDDGLIAEADPDDVAAHDEDTAHASRRRYYTLTPLGRRVLRADVQRLERAAELARVRLGDA